jgi:hypothetical protein
LEEIESAVQAILNCEHDYENRRKLCSCLSELKPEILRVAVEDHRARSWRDDASSIKSCIRST